MFSMFSNSKVVAAFFVSRDGSTKTRISRKGEVRVFYFIG